MGESNITDLKKSLETQQSERAKAELSLKSSLEDIEKIRAKFDEERAALETENSNLLKRVEDAEAQIKPVTEELSGLKQHIMQMTATIFGKCIMSIQLFNPTNFSYVYTILNPPATLVFSKL